MKNFAKFNKSKSWKERKPVRSKLYWSTKTQMGYQCNNFIYFHRQNSNLSLFISFDNEDSPPLIVSVANSYSATVNPALLWAVTRSIYHDAGSKSKTTKFPPGLTLLLIWFHSIASLKYKNHESDLPYLRIREQNLCENDILLSVFDDKLK